MKMVFAALLMSVVSFSAHAADVKYNKYGVASVPGKATLQLTKAMSEAGTIGITGKAATVLWDSMTEVQVSKANQFQPSDRKEGNGIICDKAVSSDIEGLNEGDVLCVILITDLAKGKL